METGTDVSRRSGRFIAVHLDAASRIQEVMCGLIMVLTFTLMAGLAFEKRGVDRLLIGALGCNVAWGVIDGVLYVMGRMTARRQQLNFLERINTAEDENAALAMIDSRLGGLLDPSVTEDDRARINRDFLPVLARVRPHENAIVKEDIHGMVSIFLINLVAVIPAVIPFLLIKEPRLALRTSNAFMIATLFITGFIWGKYAGLNRYLAGCVAMLIGLALVGVAIPLGG